jgi:hypothetical protein
MISDLINAAEELEDEPLLTRDINSKEDLKQLKEFVKSISTKIDKILFDDVKDELREIADDFKWSGSSQGKPVMKLEAWVISAREKLLAYPKFQNVFIGRDFFDPTVLIVSGVVVNDAASKKLADLVKEWQPPVEAKYIIEYPATTP